MKPYEVRFTREAQRDVRKLTPKLKEKLRKILLHTISLDPKIGKRLVGDLEGFYSFRLTYQDRIVYSVNEATHTIFIHRTRTHYGD